MKPTFPHIIVLYALVAVAAVALIFLAMQDAPAAEGDWQCSNVICSQVSGPESWIAANCFDTAVGGNATVVVCRVVIDGQNNLIPLAELNLTDLQVCTEYTCVQEVLVRTANRTVNVTQ